MKSCAASLLLDIILSLLTRESFSETVCLSENKGLTGVTGIWSYCFKIGHSNKIPLLSIGKQIRVTMRVTVDISKLGPFLKVKVKVTLCQRTPSGFAADLWFRFRCRNVFSCGVFSPHPALKGLRGACLSQVSINLCSNKL